jgi:hypothetical protein
VFAAKQSLPDHLYTAFELRLDRNIGSKSSQWTVL